MDENKMIDDLISVLDHSVGNGVGHLNVEVDPNGDTMRTVETMGCTDCSKTPQACSIPTLHQGLDDYE
ncbi:MAG TPA: hypothetical protein PLU43_01295 [Lachnospiraceae bacterium]|nr:hypothetical protein [Lachnospiraceae bacterium]